MSWVKVDDSFAEHPKFLALGKHRLAATGLWLIGLAYSNRYRTDGFVPDKAVPRPALAARLVEVGLWDRVDGGYRVHDFAAYQPSRGSFAARQTNAERGGKKRAASAQRDGGRFAPSTNDQLPHQLPAGPAVPAVLPAPGPARPESPREKLFGLRVAPTARAAPTNGDNPPTDEPANEAAAFALLRHILGPRAPTEGQQTTVREIADRAATRGGWRWVIACIEDRPMGADPINRLIELDNRWKQKARTP